MKRINIVLFGVGNVGSTFIKQILSGKQQFQNTGMEINEVKLVTEKKTSAFGSLKNVDSSFEVFGESYGKEPLVIQGAGAGSEVTARGGLSDVIKLTEQLKNKFPICI